MNSIDDIAEFFQVSRLVAKIRLQQLGYREFEGIYNLGALNLITQHLKRLCFDDWSRSCRK